MSRVRRAEKTNSIPVGSVVLVIDDEKTVLNVAESALSRKGVIVLTADDGKRGVEIFREHSNVISVVILDLQMPVMGGEQAFPLLHQINRDVPVILSSGFDEKEVTARFSRLKPTSFLQKPFTAQRLIEAVAAVLQER